MAFEPFVPQAILAQRHPRQRMPLPLLAMRARARRSSHQPVPLQLQLQPGVRPAEAVVLHQMLKEELDGEARVSALPVQRLDVLRPVGPDPPPPPGSAPPIPTVEDVFKNIAMRTPWRATVRRVQPLPKEARPAGQIVGYSNRFTFSAADIHREATCTDPSRGLISGI
jgi:hypothetical protein